MTESGWMSGVENTLFEVSDEISSLSLSTLPGVTQVDGAIASYLCPTPIVVTNEHFRIVYLNAAAEVIFGHKTAEARRDGRDASLMTYITSNTGAFIDWVAEEPDTGFELVLLAKNFSRFIVFVKSHYVDQLKLYAFSLIPSSVFQAESVTSMACQTVFQYSRVAIYITDNERRIVAANPSFDELLEVSGNHLIGRKDEIFYDSETSKAAMDEAFACLEEQSFWKGRMNLVAASGTRFAANVHVFPAPAARGEAQSLYVFMLEDVQEQVDIENALRRAAETDSLTGLNNRAGFNKYFSHVFSDAMRKGESLAVLFFDLDGFKEVNDRHGHSLGDELLKTVARRLKSHLKETDFVARMGGDEFVIALEVGSERDVAEAVAKKILRVLGEKYIFHGVEIKSTASIGIAIYPFDGTSADLLMESADSAMYRSKERCGNTFSFSSDC